MSGAGLRLGGGAGAAALRSSSGAPRCRPGGDSIDPERVQLNPLAVAGLGHVARIAATRTTSSKNGDREVARAEAVRHRFALQEGARQLVPHERVARCCRYLRKGESHVEVLHSPVEGRAHFGSLEVCSSVWLCPVCATKIAERRRAELVQAVNECKAGGGAVLHAAFTVRHKHGDDLRGLLERFTLAYRRLTGHRAYRELRKVYQLFGSVRALEVTHGEENGWHPHYHVLLFLSHPLDADQLAALVAALRELWARAAALEGLDMNQHGLEVRATGGAVADYVAKFGRDPQCDPWGPESELAKAHVKRARGDRSTPWDLLRRFKAGDGRAAHLWREYAGVFKGRNQLVWSPGLRALMGLEDEQSDQEVAQALPADAVHLGWLSLAQWHLVLRYEARAELLIVANGGNWGAVLAFVGELRARRLAERRRRGLEPPPPPVQLGLALWPGQTVAAGAVGVTR